MLVEQIAAAVAGARTSACLDNLARLTWRGLSEGHISECDAEALSESIQGARGRISVGGYRNLKTPAKSPPRPVSSDRRKSRERRRRLAASGAVPGFLASSFTQGEVAVLSVVARVIQRRGRCELPVDKIAGIAGVCRTVAQGALRQARRLGLLSVLERRHVGWRSDTNLVTITSAAWASWLRLKGVGSEIRAPRNTSLFPAAFAARSRGIPADQNLKTGQQGRSLKNSVDARGCFTAL